MNGGKVEGTIKVTRNVPDVLTFLQDSIMNCIRRWIYFILYQPMYNLLLWFGHSKKYWHAILEAFPVKSSHISWRPNFNIRQFKTWNFYIFKYQDPYRVCPEKSIQNSQTFAIWGKKATRRYATVTNLIKGHNPYCSQRLMHSIRQN